MVEVSADVIAEVIRRSVGGVRSEYIAETDSLSDLGIDSLAVLTIIMTAAEDLSLDLSALEDMTLAPKSVGDIAALLRDLQPLSAV